MKKPKKRSRHYVPNGALIRLHNKRQAEQEKALMAECMAKPIPEDTRKHISAICFGALTVITNGRATIGNWQELGDGLNTAMSLAEAGIGAEYIPDLREANDGIFRAELRAKKHGTWELDVQAQQAVSRALEVLDAQLELASLEEVKAARDAWRDKIVRGIAYKEAA